MGAPYSDPNCALCASYKDGIACGVCTERHTGIQDRQAKRKTGLDKRQRVARRAAEAFRARSRKRAGSRADESDVPRIAWLQCSNLHPWQSEATPGKDDPVLDPRCPVCGEFFNRLHFRVAVYNPDIACTGRCRNAKPWTDCECSCGGASHGVVDADDDAASVEDVTKAQRP
jgi:hypothetical protein